MASSNGSHAAAERKARQATISQLFGAKAQPAFGKVVGQRKPAECVADMVAHPASGGHKVGLNCEQEVRSVYRSP